MARGDAAANHAGNAAGLADGAKLLNGYAFTMHGLFLAFKLDQWLLRTFSINRICCGN